jgi:hypothetical protein
MARKPVGRLFVWAIPIFRNYGLAGKLRAEPPTEAVLLPQLAVDQRRRTSSRTRLQPSTSSGRDDTHQNDSGHRHPKTAFFISSWLMPQPARARVCRGGSRNSQQSQAERQPRGRGHLESSFWSVTLGTAQGGRSRNAKRPGALTGNDLAESADCPCDVVR